MTSSRSGFVYGPSTSTLSKEVTLESFLECHFHRDLSICRYKTIGCLPSSRKVPLSSHIVVESPSFLCPYKPTVCFGVHLFHISRAFQTYLLSITYFNLSTRPRSRPPVPPLNVTSDSTPRAHPPLHYRPFPPISTRRDSSRF